ncbi:MAG: recombinase family protein [Bdellovibrionales bacterium]
MKKVGILARVSTDEQAGREEGSIKNQRLGCRSYVEAENNRGNGLWGKIVDEYIDDGYSGKDLMRPGIRRLILDIKKGKIDCVLITEISRLSRNKETGWTFCSSSKIMAFNSYHFAKSLILPVQWGEWF